MEISCFHEFYEAQHLKYPSICWLNMNSVSQTPWGRDQKIYGPFPHLSFSFKIIVKSDGRWRDLKSTDEPEGIENPYVTVSCAPQHLGRAGLDSNFFRFADLSARKFVLQRQKPGDYHSNKEHAHVSKMYAEACSEQRTSITEYQIIFMSDIQQSWAQRGGQDGTTRAHGAHSCIWGVNPTSWPCKV